MDIRCFRPGDEERVLAFHNATFAGHAPRTRSHFDWRYVHNPAGAGEIALAVVDDRCVAVYAGMPIRCRLDGAEVLAAVHTDVGVDPRYRTGLAGSRLVLAVGHEYTRSFVRGKKPLEWGYPEPPLQRIVVRHLDVGVLRDVCLLITRPERLAGLRSDVDVAVVAHLDSSADDLWQRCSPGLRLATVRDAAYLNWRYVQHPDVAHRVFAARADGVLRGVAITRAGGPDARLTTIMDWLAPTADDATERALLRALAEDTRARGTPYLGAFWPLTLPLARRWQEDYGFLVHSTPFQECYRAYGVRAGRRWLAEHWYQTTGDIDFF